MRYLCAILVLLVLFSGERAYAQRSGPGLFLGSSLCSDVTGQIANQTFCMDYSSGGLYVWNGSQYIPISGNNSTSLNAAAGVVVTNTSTGANAQSLFQVNNGSDFGGLGLLGPGWVTSLPYKAHEVYLNSSNEMVITAGSTLHFAANSAGNVGTLDLTEDGSGNFGLNTNPAGRILTLASAVVMTGGLTINGGTTGINSALSLGGTTSVQGTMTFNAPLVMNNANRIRSVLGGGLPPTVSGSSGNCGAGATINSGSTDVAGAVSLGLGITAGNCLISFGSPWSSAPHCVVSPFAVSAFAAHGWNVTATTTTLQVQAFSPGDLSNYNWICIGN